jgi:GxxExxY protein
MPQDRGGNRDWPDWQVVLSGGAEMPEELKDKDTTSRILSEAIQVHKDLGPGFLEAIYEEALCLRLERAGVGFERQKKVDIHYLGKKIGEHRLDLLVAGAVVVELKAIRALDNIHFSTVRSYMKALGLESGLLLNFATMPLTVKKVGREIVVEAEKFEDSPRHQNLWVDWGSGSFPRM